MAVLDRVAGDQGWPLRGVPLYSDHDWHIANRGPSDHKTIASLARAVRSEPTTAAIGIGCLAQMEHTVVYV